MLRRGMTGAVLVRVTQASDWCAHAVVGRNEHDWWAASDAQRAIIPADTVHGTPAKDLSTHMGRTTSP